MLKIKNRLLAISSIIILSCNSTNNKDLQAKKDQAELMTTQSKNEYIYWVNSQRVKCTGLAEMLCLEIQKGENLNPDNWEFFYSTIKGFNYKEGTIYKLIVKETKLPPSEVPADASSIKFELVKILDKQTDPKLQLHDIWVLKAINGKEISNFKLRKQPQLEINLTENHVMGNDGCNTFRGNINIINDKKLEFESLASTRMACEDAGISDKISKHLSDVKTYLINNLELTLFDAEENEILKYKKVD